MSTPAIDLALAAAGGFLGTFRKAPRVEPSPLPPRPPRHRTAQPKANAPATWPPPDSRAGRILRAVAEIRADCAPVSTETIAVTAWKRWPATFGLRGFLLEHPDKHTVVALLSHQSTNKQTLIGRGLIERVAPRMFRLTARGRAWLEACARGAMP